MMNISQIDNSRNFKGSLSPKVIKHIRKAEKLDIITTVNKANYYGEVLTAEKIDNIKTAANNIIEKLVALAKALPEKAQIVLMQNFNELYIRGLFKDKHTTTDFHVFYPYASGPIGRLTSTKGEFYSLESLSNQFKTLLKEKDIKEDLALRIRDSIDVGIKKGKIKTDKSLQKRYDYYKEEFPMIESYRDRHFSKMEEYLRQQEIEKENSKYLPLRQRILKRFGF